MNKLPKVAIIGRANVGKSTLFNTLTERKKAIVSNIPGTTRDTLEEQLDLQGVPVVVVDTAGIRGSVDAVESEGIARSRRALAEADVALLVFDAGREFDEADRAVARMVGEYGTPVLTVLNKSDLPEQTGARDLAALGIDGPVVQTCALNDAGVASLRAAMLELIRAGEIQASELPLVTNQRHQEALRAARAHLEGSATAVADGLPADFIAIGLHGAVRVLGEVTGEDATADLLANIFERFCIGK